MDRTIKFRAWSTKNKKMYPVDEFTCNWNRNFVTKTSELVIKSTDILMQFTGLYDCEGKEIWESDIIEEFEVKAFRRVVAWDTENAAWGYKGKHKNYNWAHEWGESQGATLQSMKVIGNIYEHPNLLNNES